MEKRTPHYPLGRVKALVQAGAYRVTATALSRAVRDFALSDAEQIAAYILGLDARTFYKSMTAHFDHRIWQDVYHPTVQGEKAYLMLQIVDETSVVISFKALED